MVSTLKDGFRLLVVGDCPAPLAKLVQVAAASGPAPQRVSSAAEFAARLPELAPDVVFIDGAAATLEGLALCRSLKAHPLMGLVPVVVVGRTARTRLDAFAAGADDFLTPGVGPAAVRARVEALALAGAARRELAVSRQSAELGQLEGLRRTFRRYLSPRLADRILADVDSNVRTHAVVLFADMRGFTNLSERLAPSEVVTLLNEYFSLLTEIAFRHDGTVFSMAGDCLMVGFGVPLPQPDALLRAVATGREMLLRFHALAVAWQERHHLETGLGIGINAGEVVAGNIGSAAYMNYTIIGDVVNVASRLCQRARAGEMLFSASVKQELDTQGVAVGAVALPRIALRGRSNPVDIYCIPRATRHEPEAQSAVA